MKIAIFSDCYLDLTGGIVTVINAEKRELERRGHTVYVFSSGYPRSAAETKKLAQKHIFVVPSHRFFLRGLTPVAKRPSKLIKWLLKEHPEIADFDVFYVCYEASLSIAGLILGHRLKIPTLQAMHGREDMGETSIIPYGFSTLVARALNGAHAWWVPHPLKIQRDNYLADTTAKAKMWELMVSQANFSDYVLTPSRHFGDKLEAYGVKKPLFVVPNGVDDALIDEKIEKDVKNTSRASAKTNAKTNVKTGKSLTEMTENLGPETNGHETLSLPLHLIWHNRLSSEKRILPFLEALAIITKKMGESGPDGENSEGVASEKKPKRKLKQANPSYTLHVYGSGNDFRRAQRFAKAAKLPVTFYGNTKFPQIWQDLKRADLDILVSYNYDTFGMTLIEAEAAGTPVFYVDPDMNEIVPRGGGISASSPAVEDMAKSLNEIMRAPEKLSKMSAVMLAHRDEVRVSKNVDRLEAILTKIISEYPS